MNILEQFEERIERQLNDRERGVFLELLGGLEDDKIKELQTQNLELREKLKHTQEYARKITLELEG